MNTLCDGTGSLCQARAHKAEATTKLEQLQRDIAELSSLSPDLVEEENKATRALSEVKP